MESLTGAPGGAPLKIWCLMRDQFAHVAPVEACAGPAAAFVYDGAMDPAAMLAARPDCVLCVNDFPYEISVCLAEARRARIPSLVIQDGILEWRCQYENPLFGEGGGAPQHQPVLADKIACLGAQSARQIAAWGNPGRVEITGMPRLDHLLAQAPPAPRRPGKRILVMTAKKPGFTPAQTAVTLESLRDMKAYLETRGDLEVVWRLSKGLDETLGVENRLQDISGLELAALLRTVDAVITTPSTALLEAMLLGRPVAALDYHNVPRFVQTAWTIAAPAHIAPAVTELLDPPGRKMAFQEDCLNDSLACDGPAAPRVWALIRAMVAAARADTGTGPLGLPARMLGGDVPGRAGSPPRLSDLYPGKEAFDAHDVMELQARLARQQKHIAELEAALSHRTVGGLLTGAAARVRRALQGKKP